MPIERTRSLVAAITALTLCHPSRADATTAKILLDISQSRNRPDATLTARDSRMHNGTVVHVRPSTNPSSMSVRTISLDDTIEQVRHVA